MPTVPRVACTTFAAALLACLAAIDCTSNGSSPDVGLVDAAADGSDARRSRADVAAADAEAADADADAPAVDPTFCPSTSVSHFPVICPGVLNGECTGGAACCVPLGDGGAPYCGADGRCQDAGGVNQWQCDGLLSCDMGHCCVVAQVVESNECPLVEPTLPQGSSCAATPCKELCRNSDECGPGMRCRAVSMEWGNGKIEVGLCFPRAQ